MKTQLKNKDTLFQVFSYDGKIINVPYPFTQCDFGKNPLEEISVANRFNGESVMLPRFAVAIYDVIMGSEVLQDDKTIHFCSLIQHYNGKCAPLFAISVNGKFRIFSCLRLFACMKC